MKNLVVVLPFFLISSLALALVNSNTLEHDFISRCKIVYDTCPSYGSKVPLELESRASAAWSQQFGYLTKSGFRAKFYQVVYKLQYDQIRFYFETEGGALLTSADRNSGVMYAGFPLDDSGLRIIEPYQWRKKSVLNQ